MKVKQISCTQFAGVRDLDITLHGGIDLIYGKNETGKSTLAHLLVRTLFQNAKLDGRRDKDFVDRFFPASKKNGAAVGDFADGKLVLETEQGRYVLSKEWGQDARCTLSTPDGVLRDQTAIAAVLRELLVYGEGVYTDMLFIPQSGSEEALRALLDASKKTDAKREIIDAVSQAFVEGDGISMDALQQAIADKIDEIAGKHWDIELERPIRKAGRWASGLGEILKAYYALEDAKDVLREISALEQAADMAAADYGEKEERARKAQDEYDAFQSFVGQLVMQQARRKELERLEEETAKLEAALHKWPILLEELEDARSVRQELLDRERKDRYDEVKLLAQELQALSEKLDGRACPTAAEIAQARSAQRRAGELENKLCGMNLSAVLKTYGAHTAQITSCRAGETIEYHEKLAITEAVTINIPDVMELRLAPSDVDTEALEQELKKERRVIDEIFKRFHVCSLEGLEALADELGAIRSRMETVEQKKQQMLDGTSAAELENSVASLPVSLPAYPELREKAEALCGSLDIERYITVRETLVEGYEREYESIKALQDRSDSASEEKARLRTALVDGRDIPAAYLQVSDPEVHLQQLDRQRRQRQQEKEDALKTKTAALSKLQTYQENISGEPEYEAECAEAAFLEQKTLLRHWIHISEVFERQKEALKREPMHDIAAQFSRYLAMISNDSVEGGFPQGDKLIMNIYSKDRLVDHGKLSEGTKETVSLAFRLSVLDHLFPDGGGVIVLDDPLTDMDADRTQQACALIKECSQRHQVIFLTCKEEYATLLATDPICL